MAKEVKAKPEDTTAVQMTEAQKKAYLLFLEKEEEKKIIAEDAKAEEGIKTKVNLKWRHNINGKKYGPGRMIEIPLSLLGQLQHQEDVKRKAELRLLISNKRTFEVLQSGGAIEVGGQRTPDILK